MKQNNTINKKDKWEGSTRLRSDGRWESSICIDGVRKSLYGKTESEAKKKMREYRNQVASGYVNPTKTLFSDYCYNWLIEKKFNRIKMSTFDRYESTYLHHIKDTIGTKNLGSITTKDIQKLLDEKAHPSNHQTSPMSISSIKKIFELINPCLQYAVSHKHINSNPCIDVVIPLEEDCVIQTKETAILDDDEIQLFKSGCLTKTKQDQYKYKNGLYYLLLLNTGLRCGELLGLEWSQIDFNHQTLYVKQAVQSNIKNRNAKDTDKKRINKVTVPKTKRAIRYIPLNQQALFYLNEIQRYNKEFNIQTAYIASSSTGTRVTARNLQRTLDTITTNSGVKHISLHDLRRTFGSTLVRKGVDISVVSSLMGHASVKITYQSYIKIIEEQKASALQLIDIA